MGIDYGLFCDDCKKYVNLGEWLHNTGKFQNNEIIFDFIADHGNSGCSRELMRVFMDCDNGWLDRIDYKDDSSKQSKSAHNGGFVQ